MSAQQILILYIIFFFIKLAWESLLEILNMQHVKKHRDTVPEFVTGIMDEDTYRKSVAYTLTKEKFSLVVTIFSSFFVLGIILSGLLGFFDTWIKGLPLDPYTGGIFYIMIFALLFQLLSLPFGLYAQFVIEEKFGFNKMTAKLFWLDLLKGLLISAVIAVPLLYALFWFMDKTGSLWWLWAFGLFTAFRFLMVVLYPSVIAPLFNKFSPLEEGSLRERINKLAEKLQFTTSGIFKMDGSKRSRHSNAYFTGLGKAKRIVLYDTLLNTLKEDEIEAVLAHEIGHQKHHHINKQLIFSLVESLLGFFIISLLLRYVPFFQAFKLAEPGYHTIVVLLMFCAGPFTFFLTPLFSRLSRKYEYEADSFTVKATASAAGLSHALLALSKNNLSNLTPHPLYSFYYYSHPTLAERIAAMRQVEKSMAGME